MQFFDDSTPPTNPPIAADFPSGVSAKDVPPWFGGGGPATVAPNPAAFPRLFGFPVWAIGILAILLGSVTYLIFKRKG
jgi:hypothetical protein